MRRTCLIGLAIVLLATLSAPATASVNYLAKMAVHIKSHGTSCTDGFPTFTWCSQINTTYPGLGDIDVIPVFFDLVEYTDVGMALDWPAEWGSMEWTRCKGDAQFGTLVNPNDFVRITWSTCQRTYYIALGYGWLYATSPCFVRPSYLIQPRVVTDCQTPGDEDHACSIWSGVGGYYGDDPCQVDSGSDRSTWGAIKSIFRE
jgi:hypothetical protein